MSRLQLSFAAGSVERLKPILDGQVQPEGIDLVPSVVPPNDLFWRVPRFDPFDVAELSLTGYMWGIQRGKRWTALPVFPGWVFSCHTETLVNVDSGIDKPEELRGKRVGVPEYPVTAIMYIRDAFETEHSVKPEDISWHEERSDWCSHYRLMGYRPPANVPVQVIPEDSTLCDMLISGELDAVTRYFGRAREYDQPVLVDRSHMSMKELAAHPKVKWLYPDRKAAAIDYYKKLSYLQPIHCIIVKQEVVDKHPWVPLNLMNAFAESCHLTADADLVRAFSYTFSKEEQKALIGPDFWPVGIRRNRPALEAFLQLAYKQGFGGSERPFTLAEFFHESTLHT
jgi:4,5-dihydroxyphthalate decarboxylase